MATIIAAGAFAYLLGIVQVERQIFYLPQWNGNLSSLVLLPPLSQSRTRPETLPLEVRRRILQSKELTFSADITSANRQQNLFLSGSSLLSWLCMWLCLELLYATTIEDFRSETGNVLSLWIQSDSSFCVSREHEKDVVVDTARWQCSMQQLSPSTIMNT